jgi:hypothetical protein
VAAVANAFIPGPGTVRVPGTTGGLAAEAELLDARGGQAAAIAWARNANVLGTDSPSLSRVGDALQMAEPFADAVGDTFALVEVMGMFDYARGDYLRSWRENEAMPLRRWLMNGLHLYGHELRRARNNRSTRETSLDASGAAATASAPDVAGVVAMERAWTLTVVREACAEIESELRFAGVEIDWYVFRRHFIDGRPYRELFAETGIEPARAAVRSHAILVKLRSRIRAILARDGTPADEIEHELARMQRTVEESRP